MSTKKVAINEMTINYVTSLDLLGEVDNNHMLGWMDDREYPTFNLTEGELMTKYQVKNMVEPYTIPGEDFEEGEFEELESAFKRIQAKAATLDDATYVMLTK